MQVGKNQPSYYIIKYSRALLGLQNIDISRKEKYVQSDSYIKRAKLDFIVMINTIFPSEIMGLITASP